MLKWCACGKNEVVALVVDEMFVGAAIKLVPRAARSLFKL
jgi:hypothetical protein